MFEEQNDMPIACGHKNWMKMDGNKQQIKCINEWIDYTEAFVCFL